MKSLFNIEIRPFFLLLGLFFCASILLSVTPTLADIDQTTARKLKASGQILSLEKILEKAKAVKPGKVLETELEFKNDLYFYEIELLDSQGIVWEIKFDAKTGKLIKLEED